MKRTASSSLFRRISDLGLGRPAVEITHRDGRIQKGVLDRVTTSRDDIVLHLINQTLRIDDNVRPILDGPVPFRPNKIESMSVSSDEDGDIEYTIIHLDDEHGFAIQIAKRTRARSA